MHSIPEDRTLSEFLTTMVTNSQERNARNPLSARNTPTEILVRRRSVMTIPPFSRIERARIFTSLNEATGKQPASPTRILSFRSNGKESEKTPLAPLIRGRISTSRPSLEVSLSRRADDVASITFVRRDEPTRRHERTQRKPSRTKHGCLELDTAQPRTSLLSAALNSCFATFTTEHGDAFVCHGARLVRKLRSLSRGVGLTALLQLGRKGLNHDLFDCAQLEGEKKFALVSSLLHMP